MYSKLNVDHSEMERELEQGKEEECRIPKGRRTKRFRSPFCTNLQADGSCDQDDYCLPPPIITSLSPNGNSDHSTPSSPYWSQESLCEHTEEEQAVASYLLLLSNSTQESPVRVTPISEALPIQFSEAKSKSITSKWIGSDGKAYYRCFTCGRDFLSFQALGGHRASHKKPKLAQPKKNDHLISKTNVHEISEVVEDQKEDMLKLSMNSFATAMAKARIHQCTICGSRFVSGQALGGHMRRHRNPTLASDATSSDEVSPFTDIKDVDIGILEENHSTSPLALDLNLPAPLDEKRAVTLSRLSPKVAFDF